MKTEMKANLIILLLSVIIFTGIYLWKVKFNKEIPIYGIQQLIEIEDFIFYTGKPEEGYTKRNTLLQIVVRNTSRRPIAFTPYRTGNIAEDAYKHYYLFLEVQGRIYEVEGRFLKVNPTDGTKKYDLPGNLYLDIPINEINQYTYLLIASDKKAEDVLFKISLN